MGNEIKNVVVIQFIHKLHHHFFLGEGWTSGQGGTLLDRVRPRYFHLFLLSFSESILHVQPEQKKNNSSLSSAAAVIIQVAS